MNFRSVSSSLFLSLLFVGFPIRAFSQNINTPENFPDPNFRVAVEEFMGIPPGGEFSALEAAVKTDRFNCSYKEISDMTGIEYFISIKELDCSDCGLISLDVSRNTALTFLSCGGSKITRLNKLTILDVSNNTALEYLWCNGNQLTSLDVSNNIALIDLECDENQLTSLDISNNTNLKYLGCGNNQLTNLDISTNIDLNVLGCGYNPLTNLDVSNNTELTMLWCPHNQLTSLDVSNNTALNHLLCWGNKLTGLDVSKNTVLKDLQCYNNQLINLDISNNNSLDYLYCQNNQLRDISSIVANKGLGKGDSVDIRYNYIACDNFNDDVNNLVILVERIGNPNITEDGWLQTGFAFSPQKECETPVLSWFLY